jgi:hypothetical protein
VDDYFNDKLLGQFKEFQFAKEVLEQEIQQHDIPQINLERLMTRLDSLMPYDVENGAEHELKMLLFRLKQALFDKLSKARLHWPYIEQDIVRFAGHILKERIICITFNYDDVLDQALWLASRHVPQAFAWDPDNGYGFLCKGPASLLGGSVYASNTTMTYLLKLHGSLNWRPLLGATRPYAVGAMCHAAQWYDDTDEILDLHLEREPFIVPPVLQKQAVSQEPVMRFIWTLASGILRSATQVTFIGYSLPPTDLASRFLFRESIRKADVKVVNLDAHRAGLQREYRDVFPNLRDRDFVRKDAMQWCLEVSKQSSPLA